LGGVWGLVLCGIFKKSLGGDVLRRPAVTEAKATVIPGGKLNGK